MGKDCVFSFDIPLACQSLQDQNHSWRDRASWSMVMNRIARSAAAALAVCVTATSAWSWQRETPHDPTHDRRSAADLTPADGRPVLFVMPEHAHDGCITVAQRAAVRARIDANRERLGLHASEGGIAGTAPPPVFPFFPMGARTNRDGLDTNFVDLDPTAGTLDFNCSSITYDTHRGIDRVLRSFSEQMIGVPVYAGLDGVVVDAHDGEPDMNTINQGLPGNYVIIDHGLGIESWYFHLKNGSVIPAIGAYVRSGEQIGMTASSGNSNWPHLHFETFYLGQTFEPFAGACRPGPSGWVAQPPFTSTMYFYDFAVTTQDPGLATPPPFRLPVNAQVPTSASNLYFWFHVANLEFQTTWRVVFIRPNGTTALDSGTFPFNNNFFSRHTWTWFNYSIPIALPSLQTTPGTWHVDVYLGGQLMVHAPFEVVTTVNPAFNRAPKPISIAFDPPIPAADKAILCLVTAEMPIADVDYDIVRFRYVWKVNGGTVRDVISAGHFDVLPRSVAQPGDTVSVTVTPSDGVVDGTSVMIEHVLGQVCIADIVSSATIQPPPDGIVDGADLAYLLGQWGTCN